MQISALRDITLTKALARGDRFRGHVLATGELQEKASPDHPQGQVRAGLAYLRHVLRWGPPLIGIASNFTRRRKIHPTTARRVDSHRMEKVLSNRQRWSLEMAGQAANEQSFDFQIPLVAAFALSVYREVASQSLSRHRVQPSTSARSSPPRRMNSAQEPRALYVKNGESR